MNCIKCGAIATKRYSPDLDIKGIGMCAEHADEITMDLIVAQFDKKGWEKFEKKYLKSKDNESKIRNNKD